MDSQEIEMKTYIAILAGAILTSTTLAGDAGTAGKARKMACEGHSCCRPATQRSATLGDPYAEERFKMKFGRNTPAEEARQKAAQEAYAKNMLSCDQHGCGAGHSPKPVAAARTEAKGDPGAE